MTTQITAHGTFEVHLDPTESPVEGMAMLALSKVFSGDLVGSAEGTMLSAGDPSTGSAGYVALEVVTGSIGGRTGIFALQQFGTMHAGDQHLHYEVVPGSGRADFAGLTGTFTLTITDDVHHYALTGTLAE